MTSQAMTSQTITDSGAELLVQAASLDKTSQPQIPSNLKSVWSKLAPFAKHKRHLIYIRDMVEQSIEGKWIGGYTPNGKEAFINLPSWNVSKEELTDALAHEMHHLVRWQATGYGRTLGEAIVSEGMACWFAKLQSGWKAPWIEEELPSKEMLDQIGKEWNDERYDHSEWFFDGRYGKWVGYRIGYRLVKCALGDVFNIEKSVCLDEAEARKFLTKLQATS